MDKDQCDQSRRNHAVPQSNKHKLTQSHEASRIDGVKLVLGPIVRTREYALLLPENLLVGEGRGNHTPYVHVLRTPISYVLRTLYSGVQIRLIYTHKVSYRIPD